MLKLYLDNCCYNRPFDDLSQEKNKIEAQAIETIIKMYSNGNIIIYKSRALEFEINKITNINKRKQVEELIRLLKLESIPYSYELDNRVEELEKSNIHFMDAYHLAYAESAFVNYFITVDKQLINVSKRSNIKLKVMNPIEFLMEVVKWKLQQKN